MMRQTHGAPSRAGITMSGGVSESKLICVNNVIEVWTTGRCRPERAPARPPSTIPGPTLQRDLQGVGEFADDAAAEQQHAGDEHDALDHGDPLAELGQVVFHGDDDERADDGTEYGSKPPHQSHE